MLERLSLTHIFSSHSKYAEVPAASLYNTSMPVKNMAADNSKTNSELQTENMICPFRSKKGAQYSR